MGALLIASSIALTACGDESPASSEPPGAGNAAAPDGIAPDPAADVAGGTDTAGSADVAGPAGSAESPEDVADLARGLPGIEAVSLTYVAPDGTEHGELPADAADQAGWVVRIDLMHNARHGPTAAAEAVSSIVAEYDAYAERADAAAGASLQVWVGINNDAVTGGIEVSALAHPVPSDDADAAGGADDADAAGGADAADLVGAAHLLAETPGVVRAVFDGQRADVQVRDESDLAKVGDVVATHDLGVDTLRTADGSATLDVADVPARPPRVQPAQWPDDPSAPDCAPRDLRPAIIGHDAFTGHRVMFVAVTNTGDTSCAIQGYPELSFRTVAEQPLAVTVSEGSPFGVQDPGAQRVVIPAGARATAVAGWGAMSTAEAPEGSGNWPEVTAEILLGPTPGADPTELPLTSWTITPELDQDTSSQELDAYLADWRPITTLDIIDGGTVEVTAWAPEGTEF